MRTPAALACCSAVCLLSFATLLTAQQTVRSPLRAVTERKGAPAFQLRDTQNKRVRLSDFKGRPVVLNFWATECGGCKTELPTFVKLSETYKKTGLTVVGVSMDIVYSDLKGAAAGWAQVKPFLRTHRIPYPVLLDDGSAEKAFEVTALPATHLIDRGGRIAATYIGVVDPDDLEANVKALLAER